MKSCREVSRLVSESMERKLRVWERAGLWFHLSMCKLCSGFSRDLTLLRDAARRHADEVQQDTAPGDAVLSPEARQRIKRAVESRGS